MNIADRIHNIIDDQDIKQKALAAKLDIPTSTFNGYMTGRNQFPCDVVLQVAKELNTTTDYLLGATKSPVKPFSLSLTEQQIIRDLRALSPAQRELILNNIQFMLEQNQK